jgi:hypothetical protein
MNKNDTIEINNQLTQIVSLLQDIKNLLEKEKQLKDRKLEK